jgi:hypothetical protein
MSNDWWPAPLAHIAAEKPWAHDDIIVAEVRSFDEQPHAGQRRTFAALVPIDQIDAVKKALANLDHDIRTSGPHPSYAEDRPFKPAFWVCGKDLPSEQYEPLVLAWNSHHTTVLQVDPGFLMTYGLVPRPGQGGTVYWDDPQTPQHGVVTVSPPSVRKNSLGTHAYVSIAKDFLQDYLTQRHMALVQVFWEIRWAAIDADIHEKLGDLEGNSVHFADRRFTLGRHMGERDTIFAQVWGARLIALPGGLPISSDPLDEEGLVWPGIETPVTNFVADSLGINTFFYVEDSVLADFEGRPEFTIHPESGSVSHGTQWSVGYCDRVGRNLIRVEPKKLYEGAPPEIIRHWHKFAVAPVPDSAYPAILDEPNIAKRAKDITFAMAGLGEVLADLARSVGLADLAPEDFAGLRIPALIYRGWWTFDAAEAVARHVPLALSVDAFLDRCMSLDKLVIEGLSEGSLRQTLQAIGVPSDAIAKFRTLKLLDSVVRLAHLADTTALSISKNGALLWERLAKEDIIPAQPVAHLFALYDVRILKAHKAGDRNKRLQDELERFGVAPGEVAAGYGKILDHIYDLLTAELREATAKIAGNAHS